MQFITEKINNPDNYYQYTENDDVFAPGTFHIFTFIYTFKGKYLAYLSFMKTLFTLLLIIGAMATSMAQDSWKVVHNGKTRLEATEETEKNSFVIKSADLKKAGTLSLFIKDKPQQGWERTVMLVDAGENELFSAKGDLIRLDNARLAKAAGKVKTIKVYSMSLPTDPAQAALVRVRRIHLATILIK